jgi:hypothetical protein
VALSQELSLRYTDDRALFHQSHTAAELSLSREFSPCCGVLPGLPCETIVLPPKVAFHTSRYGDGAAVVVYLGVFEVRAYDDTPRVLFGGAYAVAEVACSGHGAEACQWRKRGLPFLECCVGKASFDETTLKEVYTLYRCHPCGMAE